MSHDQALSAHDRHVNAVLAKVHRRTGHTCVPSPAALPFDELLQREEGENLQIVEAKIEAVDRFLTVLFSVGPDPQKVMKRLFTLVRLAYPHLVLNMNQTELADLLGDKGRATQQARDDKLIEEMRQRGGYKSLVLPDQKSPSAREKFAGAQRGNRNRTRGAQRCAA
jgi:hypothetical protein